LNTAKNSRTQMMLNNNRPNRNTMNSATPSNINNNLKRQLNTH
jgi:hypothetical protein